MNVRHRFPLMLLSNVCGEERRWGSAVTTFSRLQPVQISQAQIQFQTMRSTSDVPS